MATEESIRRLEARNDPSTAEAVQTIIGRSRDLFIQQAEPRGLYQSIDMEAFHSIYLGEGDNESDTPLEHVVDEAVSLALFAVTLGGDISDRITALFEGGELAEGYILDQVASFAADELASTAGRRFESSSKHDDLAVLPYSPGYCGWHVTGQRALFASLHPEEIGVTINDSCLMHPIKSVSGVLVLAPVEAHSFNPGFPCCSTCTTLDCQDRIASLRSGSRAK